MSKKERWTIENIPDQAGRVAIVTGANTGLGFEIALALAGKNAHVVMAVRDMEKGNAARERILQSIPNASISLIELNLSSLISVRKATEDILLKYDHIDLLINNAGVYSNIDGKTEEGFEWTIGVNHLAPFALTGLLLDRITLTPNSRIVSVASVGHKTRGIAKFDDLCCDMKSFKAYCRSKLANLLFIYELQRRLKDTQTIAVAAHPGVSASDLFNRSKSLLWKFGKHFMQTPDTGALPILRAATDLEVKGGEYYGPSGFKEIKGYPKLVKSNKISHDEALQKHLWDLSEKLTGIKYNK